MYLYIIIITQKLKIMKAQIESRIAEIRKMINCNNLSESELTTLLIERDNLLQKLNQFKQENNIDYVESMRNSMLY